MRVDIDIDTDNAAFDDDIGHYADVDRETFYLICDKHGVYADDECTIFAGAYGLEDLL